MTSFQRDIQTKIEAQQRICAHFPDDLVEAETLQQLHWFMRQTFKLVINNSEPLYAISSSKAVLKLIG